jgi:predicted NBD/HSP70 family sugar kinase
MAATIGPSSENTRSAVLDLIRSGGVVSRIDLAEASGLTAPSITRIVKVLIADGLVIETGRSDSTGGKRRTLLELNAGARYGVGISLDDVRLTYVVTDLAGNLVGRLVAEGIQGASPLALIARITAELGVLLIQLDVKQSDIVGLGLALSGPGRPRDSGALRESMYRGPWGDFDVRDALERSSGFPVVLENDAACAALGEFWTGGLPATKGFATLHMATGFGCGIVIGGSVYAGSSLNAGEIGHMIIDINGPHCWCGSRGCLEILAAPRSVIKHAMANADLVKALNLAGTETELRTDFAMIARAAAQGDPRCVPLIEASANYVAAAVLSLTNLMDLDQLYLAGPGFADAGSIYYRVIRSRLENFAFVRSVHSVNVELSEVGLESAALGAAAVALQSELTPHRKAAAAT